VKINEKEVKARKDYLCDICEKPIKKGDVYFFSKGKEPKFDDNDYDKQIGIKYYQYRYCSRPLCGSEE